MQIFKFGGASVKDAENIKNVAQIISNHVLDNDKLIVVVSALGKTTNLLETIVKQISQRSDEFESTIDLMINNHIIIIHDLGFDSSSELYNDILSLKNQMIKFSVINESTNYNFIYDYIVSQGEVLSTTILYHYMQRIGVKVDFINANRLIKTDSNFTDANVLWNETKNAIKDEISNSSAHVIITQGFIGANPDMLYTTLGREGSDYTAAIIASCTDSKELTIWKDVDGVYTADPKKFPEAQIISKISYKEAIEMTFYGAQIIHPKTIKPIQNTNCILKVKSFVHPDSEGTAIGNFENVNYQPSIVLKDSQVLYSFSVRDFSFLNESNLGKIITTFGKYSLRINLMQNTAIDFMVVTDEKLGKNEMIVEDLKSDFDIKIENELKLMTIRHYTSEELETYQNQNSIILTQKGEKTIHLLMK